jgi:hypothetical protein
MTQKPHISLLRIAAILVLLAGTIVSAILTFNAGRKNASVILPALFLIWVLSPFMVLLSASFKFKHHIENRYLFHYMFMILLSMLSVIAYTGVLNPVHTKAAAVFLFTPLISWVLIVIGVVVIKRSKSE